MQQLRLFWAINLSDDLKRKLFVMQSHLRKVPVDVRWVNKHNLHITVKFLGDIDKQRIEEITRTVGESIVEIGGFELKLKGAGFFPGSFKPRIIWVGVHGDVQKFHVLHNRVERSMDLLGFKLDSNGFSPHLTLGRLREPHRSEELVRAVNDYVQVFSVLGTQTVTSIELMESQLTRQGPIYSVLDSVTLIDVKY